MELSLLRTQLANESSDGLKLLADPANNPICDISIDNSIPAVVVVWKQYATSTQVRFVHEYVLGLLENHGVHKILGDDSALATIHEEDQTWIARNWLPRAIESGLRAAASKKPCSYFGQLAVHNVQSEAPKEIHLRNFNLLTDARDWLQSQ